MQICMKVLGLNINTVYYFTMNIMHILFFLEKILAKNLLKYSYTYIDRYGNSISIIYLDKIITLFIKVIKWLHSFVGLILYETQCIYVIRIAKVNNIWNHDTAMNFVKARYPI